MSIIRNGNVTLSNLRKCHVACRLGLKGPCCRVHFRGLHPFSRRVEVVEVGGALLGH